MQARSTKPVTEVFSARHAVGWISLLFLLLFSTAIRNFADEPSANAPTDWVFAATNHLGQWIWDTKTFDKQTVRFWKEFTVPPAGKISSALIHITVDNGYTLFLDGEEIGRGSDWRTVTEYDVTQLLGPGSHAVSVEGFNDRLEGGLIFGLHIEFTGGETLEVISDKSWLVSAGEAGKWNGKKMDAAASHPVRVIGALRTRPWENWPYGMATVPPLRPQTVHFWQRGWFQFSLFFTAAAAMLVSFWLMTQLAASAKAQTFLQIERARIARDIHDDLGAQLTQLLLLGEVAQREQPEDSPARGQFAYICERARELAQAMDEVVWAVNSRRDTVRDFTSYVCKYAQVYLSATTIRCRLDVEPEIPATPFDLSVRRNLLLAVKEALNNAVKHSQANELFLRIYRHEKKLSVVVEDNGCGFDQTAAAGDRNGLTNMVQRMAEIGGTCAMSSQPGGGCLVEFTVPLPPAQRRWLGRPQMDTGPTKIEISHSET